MPDQRYRFRINENSLLLLKRCGRTNLPISPDGYDYIVYISAKKVHYFADEVVLQKFGGYARIDRKWVRFGYEIPKCCVIPKWENFSEHRTNSWKKQTGSKARRPIHGWSKKKRAFYLGVGA